MSSTSSSIVLLLLCVALYSCNARPIGVNNKETKTTKSSLFSSKNEEKSSDLARVYISSNEKPSIKNKSEAAKKDLMSSHSENRVSENNEGKRAETVAEEKHSDHAVQSESLATVSWKLPHRKRGEQQPGFNLDYAPPKTHPPVHN